jgi:Flp pilus assembly protein TadD
MFQEIEDLMQQDKWQEAQAACSALQLRMPANSRLHAYMGICHVHFGQLALAAQELSRAWALDPHFWQAGKKLIQCYDKLGNFHEALATAREVQRIRPSDDELVRDISRFESLTKPLRGSSDYPGRSPRGGSNPYSR